MRAALWGLSGFLLLVVVAHLAEAQQTPDLGVSIPPGVQPNAVLVDPVTRSLIISSDRILIYGSVDNMAPGSSSPSPLRVLGAPNSTVLNWFGSYPNDLYVWIPTGLALDSQGTLWVSDSSRVVWWKNALNLPNSAPASGVIGKYNFTDTLPYRGRPALYNPSGVSVYNDSVFVSDPNNDRVMRWDYASSLTVGANASGVLGQVDFDSYPAAIINYPQGVLATKDGVYVSSFQEVLYFTPEMSSLYEGYVAAAGSYLLSESTPISPGGLSTTSDGSIFVADINGARVLLYPGPPKGNLTQPIAVWGQPDFVQTTRGYTFSFPNGVYYDEIANALWVTDWTGNTGQVLRFPNALPRSNPSNITDVSVSFQGRSPIVIITPTGSTISKVGVQPGSINQVAANGSVVSSFHVPIVGYIVNQTTTGSKNQIFSFQLSVNNTGNLTQKMEISYTLFGEATTIDTAGISYPVSANDLKLDLALVGPGWTSHISAGVLHFNNIVTVQPPVTLMTNISNENLTTYILQSGNIQTTTIRIQHFAVVDGVNTPITFSFTRINASSLVSNNNNYTNPNTTYFTLSLVFPAFTESLFYDPDFSIVLEGSQSFSGDGGSNLLPLLALLALLIPIAFFIFGMIVLVFVVVRRRKMRAKVHSMIENSM